MAELQGPHQPTVQALGVLAGTGDPTSDGVFWHTGLTVKILDWVVSTVMPVADQGMDSGVGIIEVATTLVRAGKTSCADGFLATS